MKPSAARIALGLFITTASLMASTTASAETTGRWKNAASPSGTPYYFGVSGGPLCGGNRCTYNQNTPIILWTSSQNDQYWGAAAPGTGHVLNNYGDIVSGTPWCLHPSGSTNNSNLVIDPCLTSSIDNWRLISAESLGAPFPGCFAFQNQLSWRVMSVYRGSIFSGAHVVEYDFCQPGSNVCGSPAGYHADQFWCPVP
jgi:hypothetical protein